MWVPPTWMWQEDPDTVKRITDALRGGSSDLFPDPGASPGDEWEWDGDEGVYRHSDGRWWAPGGGKGKGSVIGHHDPYPQPNDQIADPGDGPVTQQFQNLEVVPDYDHTPQEVRPDWFGEKDDFGAVPGANYLGLPSGSASGGGSRPPWDMPSRPTYWPTPQPTPIGDVRPPPGPGQPVGGLRPFAPHGDILSYYTQALRYGGLPRSTGPGAQAGGYYG